MPAVFQTVYHVWIVKSWQSAGQRVRCSRINSSVGGTRELKAVDAAPHTSRRSSTNQGTRTPSRTPQTPSAPACVRAGGQGRALSKPCTCRSWLGTRWQLAYLRDGEGGDSGQRDDEGRHGGLKGGHGHGRRTRTRGVLSKRSRGGGVSTQISYPGATPHRPRYCRMRATTGSAVGAAAALVRGSARCAGRAQTSRPFHASPAVEARVGFLGLGNMGLPMAHCLRRAGHELVVFDSEETAYRRREVARHRP